MEFCPKCGAVLIQKKKNDGCPRCRYSAKGKIKLKTSEIVGEKKKINIISEKESEVHPVVELDGSDGRQGATNRVRGPGSSGLW